jgi:anti-sigma factor RsiW
MSHLGERITDYVFEELSSTEMAEAKAHVSQCGECKMAVEHFQRTRSLLQAVPDVDLPRSAQLVFERPRATRSWAWRWLAPVGVAAALLLAAVLVGPVHVQWQNSQLTVAFGGAPIADTSVVEQQRAEIAQLQGGYDYLDGENKKLAKKTIVLETYLQLLSQRSSPVGD